MYRRQMEVPSESFFLFGPRGTGKTTWLRQVFNPKLYIDLLRSDDFFPLIENPGQLRNRVLSIKDEKAKVVIDEIQRCPELLNEVHALIEDFPQKFQFALTGSSARKLRKNQANLLAGRALTRYFFPLTFCEIGKEFDLDQALKFGTLPKTMNLESDSERRDYLLSYAQTYLREEIQQEALVRNLSSYNRFLKHLSLMNGQVLNLSNISRESGVKRAPLENYMSILEDTLMGVQIEPIHLRAKVKEVSTPKFYFFDCGIVRALSGEFDEGLGAKGGPLFETLVLNELRAYSSISKKYFDIHYWGTYSNNEVDFILTKGNKRVGVEVKYSKKWKSEFKSGLETLLEAKKISSAYVVFAGNQPEKHDSINFIPFGLFCEELNKGEII